jgi:hypothetical protein
MNDPVLSSIKMEGIRLLFSTFFLLNAAAAAAAAAAAVESETLVLRVARTELVR